MGLDMYLSKAELFGGYDYKQIEGMKDQVEFVSTYEDSLEISKDFDGKYNENHYWDFYGESKEDKKERIRKSLNEFITESRERYYSLKDKYNDELKETLLAFYDSEVGYWRKANHIHAWFVDNVQNGEDDCETYPVSKKQLEKLKSSCQLALNNEEHASSLLPTRPGFFFGGTDYDEYYQRDIKDTLKIIDEVVANTDFEKEVILYTSSW